jgi:hypothetical protein
MPSGVSIRTSGIKFFHAIHLVHPSVHLQPETMRRSLRASLILCGALTLTLAQPADLRAQTFTIDGFVKADYIFDTRQVFNFREGYFHLFPLGSGEENETSNLLFAGFQTRLTFTGAGTQAFGADASAVVEGDFLGATNATVNHLLLRRAFVRLDWGDREILLGQDWSPLFTLGVVPQTVGFNTGAPFQPFARFPQATFTWRPANLWLTGSLTMQRDGFSEVGGAKLQQQAGIPGAHLHARYVAGNSMVGAGGYMKWIRPTLTSDRFDASAVTAYARYSTQGADFRAKGVYGTDLTDHLMTGGFVRTTGGEFVPLQVASAWLDAMTTTPVSIGMFVGYLRNMGATTEVSVGPGGRANTRGADIADMFRMGPRIWLTSGRTRLAAELEITAANYSTRFDESSAPDRAARETVTNVRAHVAAFYFF